MSIKFGVSALPHVVFTEVYDIENKTEVKSLFDQNLPSFSANNVQPGKRICDLFVNMTYQLKYILPFIFSFVILKLTKLIKKRECLAWAKIPGSKRRT